MSKMIRVSELPDFDVTEYLEDDQAIAEYLACVLEEDDPDLLIAALGDVARARGMTEIARKTGLAREALYRGLRDGASPRFDTVMRVMRALGVQITAKPVQSIQEPNASAH
ncbi:addiction module antidote protein [Thiolapillus sp.]|uniref:addiction module antidote protein n=1 Tax=Thiolapillus sp. TaxID=2017437 RepID=UPI0025F2C075|nr:addiction module antidote protein [Thiolapillus sp.]